MSKFDVDSLYFRLRLEECEKGSQDYKKVLDAYARYKIVEPVRDILYRHGLVNNLALREDIIEYIDHLLGEKSK